MSSEQLPGIPSPSESLGDLEVSKLFLDGDFSDFRRSVTQLGKAGHTFSLVFLMKDMGKTDLEKKMRLRKLKAILEDSRLGAIVTAITVKGKPGEASIEPNVFSSGVEFFEIHYSVAKEFLGKEVTMKVERKIGSVHPKHADIVYGVNYGCIPGTMSPDGEELDAYLLGVDEPVEEFLGECVGYIHRLNDDDDKLIIAPVGQDFTDEAIREMTQFQERFFTSEIIRK